MPSREQNKILVKDRIIQATQSLLDNQKSEGISAISSRQIALDAGISYQTLYNHYSSQAQIYAALLKEKSAPLSLQLDLEVKNYEQDLATTFAAIDTQRLAHITPADKPIWQFIANNMHTNMESTVQGERTEETSLISILDPQVYERTHRLLHMAQGMGHLRTQIDLQLLAYTLICLTDYALTRYLRSEKVGKASILQTTQEQYALVLSNMDSA
jgi:AcrR family transcriptional regulator